MVVLVGWLLLSVTPVLCSGRPWLCSAMELSGNSVRNPSMASTVGVLPVRVPWLLPPPSHLEFGFQGTSIILCSVTDLFLALLGVTPTSACQDFKGDELSVATAFAFRSKPKPLLDF